MVVLLEMLHKGDLHVRRSAAVILGFIVQLVANDGRMIVYCLKHLGDDAITVIEIGRMRDIHQLAGTVAVTALLSFCHDIWVFAS